MRALRTAPWRRWLDSWLERRLPAGERITLDQRRIFIVPTRLAMAMAALALLLFLLGNLFQNTLAYLVSFYLLAMIAVSIHYTYRNISGLRLRAAGSTPCFAGQRAVFRYRIDRADRRPAHSLALAWEGQDVARVELAPGAEALAELSCAARLRGRLQPPRLRLESRYPLGLIVAWSWLRFEHSALVYPAPLGAAAAATAADAAEPEPEAGTGRDGHEEIDGVRAYRPGDSPRRVHWRKSASAGELLSKTFASPAGEPRWLDWAALHGDPETRLSLLCAQVLAAHASGASWGLRLPGEQFAPAAGAVHRERCLRALALHGQAAGSAA